MTSPDDDLLDGCAALLEASPFDLDDPETVALRPLFPGDLVGPVDWLADQWNTLFADGVPGPLPGAFDVCKTIDPGTGDHLPSIAELHAAGHPPETRGGPDELARLQAAGCRVIEVAGWRTRGRFPFAPDGVVDHHTAGPSTGDAPSLGTCINGRPDLSGPLCTVLTARGNTIYLVAAGRANHAGEGSWRGRTGNGSSWGNERENDGRQAWRDDQHVAAARANAALLKGHGPVANHCEHKEWSPGRKPDAHTVSGGTMRDLVARFLAGDPPVVHPPDPPANRAVGMTGGGPMGGYWIVDANGKVTACGVPHYGDADGVKLAKPAVGIVAHPSGAGYWIVFADGGVADYGAADYVGSVAGAQLAKPIVGGAATPTGRGLWLVAADGGIFALGGARFYGSLGGVSLNAPIVGMAASPSGGGYLLAGGDGGVFAFGDARHVGALPPTKPTKPVVALGLMPAGDGYSMVAADGGAFHFGEAKMWGNLVGVQLAAPVSGVAMAPDGRGYWMLGADGGVFAFGSALHLGRATV